MGLVKKHAFGNNSKHYAIMPRRSRKSYLVRDLDKFSSLPKLTFLFCLKLEWLLLGRNCLRIRSDFSLIMTVLSVLKK